MLEKKRILGLLTLLVILIALPISIFLASNPKPQETRSKAAESSNVMVGFWSAGMWEIDHYADQIPETADVSNVAIFSGDWSNTNGPYLPGVQKAASFGLKSMLMVQEKLFSPNNPGVLLTDYAARFDSLWAALGASQVDVAGFYLTDEPYWNNSSAGSNAISESQLKANLNTVAAYIHQKAPRRPIAVTEAYPIVSRPDFASLIPENVDYIGVNCYLAFGDVCSESNIASYVSKIISSKQPNQKLIITADGYWATPPSAQNDADMKARIIFWEQLLAPYFASNQIGAFTPFIYQSIPQWGLYGISAMPQSLAEMRGYMTEIRRTASVLPPPPPTTTTTNPPTPGNGSRPQCNTLVNPEQWCGPCNNGTKSCLLGYYKDSNTETDACDDVNRDVSCSSTSTPTQVSKLPTATVSVTPGTSASNLLGDINKDNRVDLLDFNILRKCWVTPDQLAGCKPGESLGKKADLNSDGRIDDIDYTIFLKELLRTTLAR